MYKWFFNHGYSRASDSYKRQVAELLLSIFQECQLDCLKKLDTHAYHATQTTAAPEVELLDLPEAYLPLILPSFNEEKYMNHQAKEGDENTTEVDGTGTSNELGARGDTNRYGEDQIIPPKV